MKLPADFAEECALVRINLVHFEAGHLTPGLSRVVAILQILRSQDKSCKKHSSPAHKRAVSWTVHRLFHSKVALGYVRLDEHQVVQRDLQRGVAGARATQSLFDVRAQRQYTASAAALTAAGHY